MQQQQPPPYGHYRPRTADVRWRCIPAGLFLLSTMVLLWSLHELVAFTSNARAGAGSARS